MTTDDETTRPTDHAGATASTSRPRPRRSGTRITEPGVDATATATAGYVALRPAARRRLPSPDRRATGEAGGSACPDVDHRRRGPRVPTRRTGSCRRGGCSWTTLAAEGFTRLTYEIKRDRRRLPADRHPRAHRRARPGRDRQRRSSRTAGRRRRRPGSSATSSRSWRPAPRSRGRADSTLTAVRRRPFRSVVAMTTDIRPVSLAPSHTAATDAFVERLFGSVLAAARPAGGLSRRPAGLLPGARRRPLTSTELAARTGTDERYARSGWSSRPSPASS